MRYFLVLFMCSLLLLPVSAHSGGTDSKGGHHSPSGYHYHHGNSAHQHTDLDGDGILDCPLTFVYETDTTPHDTTAAPISQSEDDSDVGLNIAYAGIGTAALAGSYFAFKKRK